MEATKHIHSVTQHPMEKFIQTAFLPSLKIKAIFWNVPWMNLEKKCICFVSIRNPRWLSLQDKIYLDMDHMLKNVKKHSLQKLLIRWNTCCMWMINWMVLWNCFYVSWPFWKFNSIHVYIYIVYREHWKQNSFSVIA